ncbi:MAG TPA: hypothetical protein VEA41_22610 [Salinarimonas sp.]|nr:hypothetical protein [Salinarimonas sp.]
MLVRCQHGRIRVRCQDPGCIRERTADTGRSLILAPVRVAPSDTVRETHGESGATVRTSGPTFNPLDFQRAMVAQEQADRANQKPERRKRSTSEPEAPSGRKRRPEPTAVQLETVKPASEKRVTVRRSNGILSAWDRADPEADRARILDIAARAAVRMERETAAAVRRAEAEARAAERARVEAVRIEEARSYALAGCNPTGCGTYTLSARSWWRNAGGR